MQVTVALLLNDDRHEDWLNDFKCTASHVISSDIALGKQKSTYLIGALLIVMKYLVLKIQIRFLFRPIPNRSIIVIFSQNAI